MAYQQTRKILKKEGLAPKKRLGQNFLVHQHTADRIARSADLDKTDTVIEVGVGLGALTMPLATMAEKVIGIEADSGIVRMHQKQEDLPPNVVLRHEDILKTNLPALKDETQARLKIVANLPYSISSPFLFRLIEFSDCIHFAVVMLQKEVAERLMAKPGTKAYGAPTVLLASCADVEPMLLVKPAEFHPKPKVDSMVIKISFFPIPERVKSIGPYDKKLFKRVVNAAFGQRRKTLVNALSAGFKTSNKQEIAQCIQQADIDPGIRAERLKLEDFVRLSSFLQNKE